MGDVRQLLRGQVPPPHFLQAGGVFRGEPHRENRCPAVLPPGQAHEFFQPVDSPGAEAAAEDQGVVFPEPFPGKGGKVQDGTAQGLPQPPGVPGGGAAAGTVNHRSFHRILLFIRKTPGGSLTEPPGISHLSLARLRSSQMLAMFRAW